MQAAVSAGPVVLDAFRTFKDLQDAVGLIREGYSWYTRGVQLEERGTAAEVCQNDASLGRLQSSIHASCQAIRNSQVQITPSEFHSVDLQSVETDIREFVERCKADPQRQGIADECRELEVRLDRVFMRIPRR